MNRVRFFGALLVLLVAPAGCSAIRPAPSRTTEPPPQTGRYTRQAVPDAVMLPDQAGSFYRDTPAP
jgi:hypothetical protein